MTKLILSSIVICISISVHAQFSRFFNPFPAHNTISIYYSDSTHYFLSDLYDYYQWHDTAQFWSPINILTSATVRPFSSFRLGDTLFIGDVGTVHQSNSLGPNSIDLNLNLSTNGNRRVHALHVFDRYLYAGTNGSGIYRKHLDSANWHNLNSNLPSYLDVVEIHEIDSIIYISTNNGLYSLPFRSNSFIPAGLNGSNNIYVYSIRKDPISNQLIVGTDLGLYKKSSATNSTFIRDNNLPLIQYKFIRVLFYVIYAASFSDHIYKSTNQGSSWANIHSGLPVNGSITEVSTVNNNIYVASLGAVYKYLGNTLSQNSDIVKTKLVSVFPNPTNSTFQINSLKPNKKIESINLFDNSGNKMELFELNIFRNEIDISHFPKGVYYLHIVQSNNHFYSKIIKL